MSDPHLVDILSQGTEVWNAYREKAPFGIYNADLSDSNLDNFNLTRAKLCNANLKKAKLNGAFLDESDLSGADLRDAELKNARLERAILIESNLGNANLSGAELQNANFSNANLSGANLNKADLTEAKLSKINLNDANLGNAIFFRVDLTKTVLKGNNFSGVNLVSADLSSADLENAVLEKTDLRAARLLGTNLKGAMITGAKLYGTSRENWIIDGIKCDYVYWDSKGEVKTPKDRDFKPGEFEELYRQMPTVEYVFEQTITPTDLIVMGKIVEEINNQNPEYKIRLDSIQSQAENRAIFKIKGSGDAKAVIDRISRDYEIQIAALKGKKEALMAVITELMNKPSGPTFFAEGDILMRGDQVKTSGQKGDAFIAKDQATVNVNKITNPAAKELIEQILQVIKSVEVAEDDKADAEQQLSNFCTELEKPQPEKGRLKRFYDRMIDVVPKIAEKLPWSKIIGAIVA